MPPRYRVGCTGWGYDDWRGPFYPARTPPGEYLARYGRVFDLVEVDSSFYRTPSAEMTERWSRDTPPGFVFTMKLPGELTHEARLRGVEEPLYRFLEATEPLRRARKLGPFVLQLPPSFTRSEGAEPLEAFLEQWPRGERLAVELRHGSWWTDETYAVMRAHGASLVWNVHPATRPPPVVTADFLYVRLIGDRELAKFDRIQRDLRPEMVAMKERLEKEGMTAREIFLLVNNHFMGFAPATAVMLQEILGLPRADLSGATRDTGQRALGEF